MDTVGAVIPHCGKLGYVVNFDQTPLPANRYETCWVVGVGWEAGVSKQQVQSVSTDFGRLRPPFSFCSGLHVPIG
jgi:hypothetical protein